MLQAFPKGLRHRIANYFLNPSKVIEDIDIRSGDNILEIGNPIGFFAPSLLNKVGMEGKVYVAGPNDDSFGKLSHLADRKELKFILLKDLITGDGIKPGDISTVILTNLLSSSAKPDTFCLSIGQFLRPGSEVILIDWDNKFKEVGPSMSQRVTKEQALKLMHKCGMRFKRILELPGYHYGLVFSFESN
jgi:hypothetical protein